MCIATSSTVAKGWKQPRRPWMNEWVDKMWYIYKCDIYERERERERGEYIYMHIMEYHSALKRKEIDACHMG